MSLTDCILMTVFNATVCICLPALIGGLKSRNKTKNKIERQAKSQTVHQRSGAAQPSL